MSAPVCLRSAFGACRPRTTTTIPLRSSLIKSRTYADKTRPEIRGVPKTSSKEEQKRVLDNVPETAPPKRAPLLNSDPDSTSMAVAGTAPAAVPAVAPETPPKRLMSNMIAAYRTPMKHHAQYGVPVASLQLRSFSLRSLEYFADFALRAAYYLNLPATGPVALPKRRERWTVIRSNFVNKKSQENFERITYKRNITILDGEKSAVEVWLAVLRKWQFYGVGMKANVWDWEGIDVASKMEAQSKEIEKELEATLANFGWNKSVAGSRSLQEMLDKQGAKHVGTPLTDVREASRGKNTEL